MTIEELKKELNRKIEEIYSTDYDLVRASMRADYEEVEKIIERNKLLIIRQATLQEILDLIEE